MFAKAEVWDDTECALPSDPLQPLLRWFLVFTKRRGECTAKANLERQGYRVYYPRLAQPFLCRGRWIERIVALFPRYLFIQIDPSRQSLRPVCSTAGVANVVRFGPKTAVVPDAVVNALMQRADQESGLHKLAHNPFELGGEVNIVAGLFEGLEGVFQRDSGEDRVIVLLNLLGQETPVRVPASYVMKKR